MAEAGAAPEPGTADDGQSPAPPEVNAAAATPDLVAPEPAAQASSVGAPTPAAADSPAVSGGVAAAPTPMGEPVATADQTDAPRPGSDIEPSATEATAGSAEPAGGTAGGGTLAEGSQAAGDCGPDVSGAGGPGAALAEPAPAATPDVSGAAPADAMAAVAQLPPAEMGAALGGVGTAAATAVAADRAQLAAQPPSLERPSGSPETRPAGAARAAATSSAAAQRGVAAARVTPTGGGGGTPSQVAGLPEPGPAATLRVAAPPVAGGQQHEVTAADAQALRDSVDELPVTDPALAIDAGPAPTVTLDGDADPQLATGQRTQVEQRTTAAAAEARTDAGRPLGEGDIYPTVPAETLTAEIPAATPAPPTAAIAMPDEATAIVAREQQTEAVRAAATNAQGQMVADRQGHDQQVVEARAASQQEMDAAVRENAEQQATQRDEARTQVRRERAEWTDAQRTEVDQSRTDADREHAGATTAISTERVQADRDAAGQIAKGNTDAAAARRDAERDARAERERGRHESSGVLGWLADRARSFFNALKRGLQRIFDAARSLVRRAIKAAQELASRAIDAARRRIVGLIRAVGDRLMAIADRVLAAFPALRDRFRAAIRQVVDAAVAAVNRLADALKAGLRRILSALGSLIEGALGLLERAYMAVVDVVANAVQGAIRAAQAIVQLIGFFAQIIRDVASDPIGWIRNLGASIVDGLRNHVWRVLKCAVKAWFDAKVEAILGLGRMIFDVLRNGGINLAQIGLMVWEALKAALPTIAIQLAIEKLLSLLVPAASAVMLIIDGIRAAWGAISRIIAAIDAFMRYLLAVKGGNAGRQFAEALAAGAIALIDFLSNFLVVRLRGPAAGVGGRLGGIAARLGRVGGAVARTARRAAQVVRRVAPGVARVAGRVGGAVLTGARAVGRGVRAVGRTIATGAKAVGRTVVAGARAVGRVVVSGARAVGRTVVAGARALGRTVVAAGRAVGRRLAAGGRALVAALARRFPRVAAAFRRVRTQWQRARAKFRAWRERRRQRRQANAQQRLDRAVASIRPALDRLLRKGVGGWRLTARLLWWRLRWRLSSLSLSGEEIVARINPSAPVGRAALLRDAEIGRALEPILEEAESAFLSTLARRSEPELAEARRGLEQGDPAGFSRLTSAQQTSVLRDVRSGRVPVQPETRFPLDQPTVPGGALALRAKNPANLAEFEVVYPRAPSARPLTPASGSYVNLASSVSRMSRALGVPSSQIMDLVGSRDEGVLASRFAALRSGMTPGRQALATRDLLPVARGLRLQTQALESARAFGQLPVSTIAGQLGLSGRRLLDPRLGGAPMAFPLSSSAPQARRRELAVYPQRRSLDPGQREAEAVRRARTVRVFRELERSARRGNVRTLPGEQGRALRELAEAFRTWLRLHVSGKSPEALVDARMELALSLIAYLDAFEGGR